MEILKPLIQFFGPGSALLILALIIVWKEWRKSSDKVVELLTEQLNTQTDMNQKYYEFSSVLSKLAEALKE